MSRLDTILDALDRHHQRASYGAVAGLLGTTARSVLQGRPKNRRHSWVVNQETGKPTGYHDFLVHPALEERSRVLTTTEELSACLAQPK